MAEAALAPVGTYAPTVRKVATPSRSRSPLPSTNSLHHKAIAPDSPVSPLRGTSVPSLEIDCASPRSKTRSPSRSPGRATSPVQPRAGGKTAAGSPLQATRALSREWCNTAATAYDVQEVRPFIAEDDVALQPPRSRRSPSNSPPEEPKSPRGRQRKLPPKGETEWEQVIHLDDTAKPTATAPPKPTSGATAASQPAVPGRGSFKSAMATVQDLRAQQDAAHARKQRVSAPVGERFAHVGLPPLSTQIRERMAGAEKLPASYLRSSEPTVGPTPPPFLVVPVIDFIHGALDDLEASAGHMTRSMTAFGAPLHSPAQRAPSRSRSMSGNSHASRSQSPAPAVEPLAPAPLHTSGRIPGSPDYAPAYAGYNLAVREIDSIHHALAGLEQTREGINALDAQRGLGERFEGPLVGGERAKTVALERLHARVGRKVSGIRSPGAVHAEDKRAELVEELAQVEDQLAEAKMKKEHATRYEEGRARRAEEKRERDLQSAEEVSRGEVSGELRRLFAIFEHPQQESPEAEVELLVSYLTCAAGHIAVVGKARNPTVQAKDLLSLSQELGPSLSAALRTPAKRGACRAVDGSRGSLGLEVCAALAAAWAQLDWSGVEQDLQAEAIRCLLSTHAELARCGWRALTPVLRALPVGPVLEDALRVRAQGFISHEEALWQRFPAMLCLATQDVMRLHPSLRAAGHVVFATPTWDHLQAPLATWGKVVAHELVQRFTQALKELDPARAWKVAARENEQADGLQALQAALVEGGADMEYVTLLDRLLYHPLRQAIRVHVEDCMDPEHVYSIGSNLAPWIL